MDAQALRAWRTTLLVLLAGECTRMLASAWSLTRFQPAVSGSAWAGFLASHLVLLFPLYVVTLYALWRFLGPRGHLRSGVPAVLGMWASFQIFASAYTVHHQDFFQGGAVLVGFFLGEAYAWLLGIRTEGDGLPSLTSRGFGATGGLAMFAGTYIAAGLSKLRGAGLGWATSSTVRLMVLSHTEVDDAARSADIMRWIGASPRLCMVLEGATLAIQLGAFMLIVGPRARRIWAALIIAFHLGIYLSSNILFLEPMVFAASLAFPWALAVSLVRRGRDFDDAQAVDLSPFRARARARFLLVFGAVVGLLALADCRN
jgi:hypothetical protein